MGYDRFSVPIEVRLLDSMGTDLDVVNAARVSFNKETEEFTDKDRGLINYLAKNGHWTPFAHCFLKYRIKMPIFVARQMVRHTVGVVINEVSRRYIDTPPEYYRVGPWRERAANKKQGSLETPVANQTLIEEIYRDINSSCDTAYDLMLRQGVCPEQARMVLPLSTMTEWIYSGSLYAMSRIVNLRVHPHAQEEVKIVAEGISFCSRVIFPHSWQALVDVNTA